jgi:N-acetylneuraminate synthase
VLVSDLQHCLVIAEAGVNHNGALSLAHQLVDAAADAGADIVKFQTFRAERLASSEAPKAAYQRRETGGDESQLDMLRALELSEPAHRELLQHCKDRGIGFLSSPFDIESLGFLISLGVDRIKLGSGELTNAPMLLAAAQTGLPLILSTGMSTMAEVEAALGVLAFGYLQAQETPSSQAFRSAWANPAARELLGTRVILLHCTTEYPAPRDQVNLRAMQTLVSTFGLACGYSDHTQGIAVSLAATALGARVIEKHFTLDRTMSGPDHKASIEPPALRALVEGIREIESAMGDGVKVPMPVEIPNMIVARKSLVAARPIARGATITADDLAVKRPGSGRSPLDYWDVVGSTAAADYLPDQLIGATGRS